MEQELLRDVQRPRLTAAASSDAKRVQKAFLDLSSLLIAVAATRVQTAFQDMSSLLIAVARKLHKETFPQS